MAGSERTLRGRVAIIGIGETAYHRHGQSPEPEFKMVARAVLAACRDAGLDPRDIDGFASYADDRSSATRLATALGVRQMRSATLQWGGGGGGCAAAVANGAAAIVAGLAECVVVYRGLAQGQFGRFGQNVGEHAQAGPTEQRSDGLESLQAAGHENEQRVGQPSLQGLHRGKEDRLFALHRAGDAHDRPARPGRGAPQQRGLVQQT